MSAAKFSAQRFAKSFLAFLLTGILLLSSGAIPSASLHKLLHADADHPDHSCVFTLLAHGQVDVAEGGLTLVAGVWLFTGVCRLGNLTRRELPADLLPPGRAPPGFSVLS